MRTVTFGVGCSLDNFIAGEDHAVDWLLWTDEVAALTGEYWKTIDTVVMGRKTYEVAVASGTTAYPGATNYVFSRRLKRAPSENVRIVAEDAGTFVRRLKRQAGRGICVMGGGQLARSLLEADAIDELTLNIHPILLGSGIPLFPPLTRRLELELLRSRTLKNGCVLLSYRVRHRGGPTHQNR